MNICIVGVGYVGLITGTCFAEYGTNVICVDNDRHKIESLKKGGIPIYEPGLEELLERNIKAGRLEFSTDLAKGVKQSLAIFIAVGTPRGSENAVNLDYVYEVAKTIGHSMEGYKVVVTKSTVPAGTGRKIKEIIRENQPKHISFDVVSNPEFLREGSAIEDFMRPNRIIIGAESEQAIAIMKDLYAPLYLIETPMVITNMETAEMIKYSSNAFLATKISFINELANICEKMGADVHQVAKGMGLDNRIGPKFLHAGPGYGGSCFPKDTRALAESSKSAGYSFKILGSVIEVNDRQPLLMAEKIEKPLNGIKGKKLAVLGLSFKPNTDDIRESPAIVIIKELQKKGAAVCAFDPAAMESARKELDGVAFGQNAYEVIEGADALVIITEWNEFRNLDWARVKELISAPVLFDLRNIYEPEKMEKLGFQYHCVGRG